MYVYVWGSVGEGNGACVKAGLPDHPDHQKKVAIACFSMSACVVSMVVRVAR